MSEECFKMPYQTSLNAYPALSIQTAKCFPQDFFGDHHQRKEKQKIESDPFNNTKKGDKNMMGQTGRFNTLSFQKTTKEEPIEENIVSIPNKFKDINELPFSHRQMKNIIELDIENDEEPSTSGSYGIYPLSNGNSPNSFMTISPNYSLGKIKSKVKVKDHHQRKSLEENKRKHQQNTKCHPEAEDLSLAFKETGHFFQCQTEVNEPEYHHHKPSSTKNSRIKKSSTSKTSRNQSLLIEKSSNQIMNLDKSKTSNKSIKNNNSKQISPKLKSNPTSQRNNSSHHSEIKKDRPKSVLESRNKALPAINTPNIFTKELTDLIGNVPQEYIDDPEIKKGLNTLLKNLNDFKQVITNKQTKNPIQSFNRVFNKNANNKPIKIINNHLRKSVIH